MNIRPIRTDEDHRAALAEIDRLWGSPEDTPEGDRLDVLITLVGAYEDKHYPVPDVDPVDVLHFAIHEMGRSQTDLARILGARSRASEILNRKRPLTLEMIRAICREWKLPVEALMRSYPLAGDAAGAREAPTSPLTPPSPPAPR